METTVGTFQYTQLDGGGEATTHGFNVSQATDGAAWDTLKSLQAAYITALEPVIAGQRHRISLTGEYTINQTAASGDSAVERENKMLVRMKDLVTGNPFRFSVGCPNFAVITRLPGTKNLVDLSTAEIATWVGAIENFARHPTDGNLGVVQSIQLVGRNI